MSEQIQLWDVSKRDRDSLDSRLWQIRTFFISTSLIIGTLAMEFSILVLWIIWCFFIFFCAILDRLYHYFVMESHIRIEHLEIQISRINTNLRDIMEHLNLESSIFERIHHYSWAIFLIVYISCMSSCPIIIYKLKIDYDSQNLLEIMQILWGLMNI